MRYTVVVLSGPLSGCTFVFGTYWAADDFLSDYVGTVSESIHDPEVM